MHVIVTRPTHQAASWLEALQAEGHFGELLPLIEIASAEASSDLAAWQAALRDSSPWDAVMFVSGNAVEHFFKRKQPMGPTNWALNATDFIATGTNMRLWATGPGTVQALLAVGVSNEQIDAPAYDAGAYDSEALWQRVQLQIQRGSRVLIVRGRDVGSPQSSRDWLAQQIQAQGGQVSSLVVYERRTPHLSPKHRHSCQTWLCDGSVWLFSSSQALRNLPSVLDASQGICICTHERIADAARQRGFAVVCTSRPTVRDVMASIKSLHA